MKENENNMKIFSENSIDNISLYVRIELSLKVLKWRSNKKLT